MHDPGRLCLLNVGPRERLLVSGAGGASFYGLSERKHDVLLHVVKRASGRIEIVEARVITAPAEITAPALRAVPLNRISAALNLPAHRDELRELLADPPSDPPREDLGALGALVPGVQDPATDPSWAENHLRAIEAPQPPRRKIRRRPLQLRVPPEGTTKPDRFYEQVADLYQQEAARTKSPAKAIAEANDVDPEIVRRWVKEARRRRLLEQGTRGSAGW